MDSEKNESKKPSLFAGLFNYLYILVIVILISSSVLAYLSNKKALNKIIQIAAINNAKAMNETLSSFRTLYTRNVVSVAKKSGLKVSHLHQGRDDTIPLPATMSIDIGRMTQETGSGTYSKLYSPYPFPWRAQTGGLRDKFQQDAWEFLKENPDKSFYRVETVNDEQYIRYATPDLLRESCVKCHNTHPDTPKIGWKVGDLRGILETVQPMINPSKVILEGASVEIKSAHSMFVLSIVLSVIGIIAIYAIFTIKLNNQKKLEANLIESNKTLEAVNDELKQFAYRTSHDMKAPLVSIESLSQLIEMDLEDADYDEVKKNVKVIHDKVIGLKGFISNILDLTRASHLDEVQPIDVDKEINAIAEQFFTDEIKIEFSYDPNHNTRHLNTNLTRFRQIIENLISNSAKYYNPKSRNPYVRISTWNDDKNFYLSVTDNGIGIPKDNQDKVFKMFSRLHKTSIEGTGLGLYLIKKHVDGLGGKIKFESTEGLGTVFTIQLPIIK